MRGHEVIKDVERYVESAKIEADILLKLRDLDGYEVWQTAAYHRGYSEHTRFDA